MHPRRLLPALLVACVLAVVATSVVTVVRWRDAPGERTEPVAVGRTALEAWDAARAAAWSRADAQALSHLYVPGSRAGRRDVALLRRYADRGLRVEGMQTQVLAFEEVEAGATRVVVEVTDRVVGAVAVAGAGEQEQRTALPSAHPARRRIVLVHEEGTWRAESVRALPEVRGTRRPQAIAAASTSRTS